MSHRTPQPALLVPLLLAVWAGPAAAQTSTTRGWSLGFQAQGASLSVESNDANTGGGAGIRAGYGINRIVTFFLAIDGATIDAANAPSDVAVQWNMAHVDLGARFHFANALRRWIPYLEAAVGGRGVSLSDAPVDGETKDVTISGADFTVGGGLSVYLKRTLALETEVKYSSGQFTDVAVGTVSIGGFDIDARSVRFGLGLVWWP